MLAKYIANVKEFLASPERIRKAAILVVLSALFLFFNVVNNVSGPMMSYVMPTYPSFLLYWSTFLYALMFLGIGFVRRDRPFSSFHRSWAAQKHFLILALLTGLNGVFFQFSTAWVDGSLTQILGSLITPFVYVTNLLILKDRFSRRENAGVVIVCVGIVIGMIPLIIQDVQSHNSNNNSGSGEPSTQNDQWYWIIAFVMSVVFQALQATWQDVAFRPSKKSNGEVVKEATCLWYYNFYSLAVYLFVIQSESARILNGTMQSEDPSYAWINQGHAFACYFGDPYPGDVADGSCPGATWAWLWPTIFSAAYAGMYFTQAVLIKMFGAVFPTFIGALAPALAAGCFSVSAIVGSQARPFQWETGLAFVFIVAGLFIKGMPPDNYIQHMQGKDEQGDILPKKQPVAEGSIQYASSEHAPLLGAGST